MFDFLALFPGVPLFFMVSGFLITDSYLNSSSLKEYFIKRGLRIYPALALNILVLELVLYYANIANTLDISFYQYLLYLLSYILTAVMGIGTTISGIDGVLLNEYYSGGFYSIYPSGVLWTLSVELSFYFLLPFVLIFKKDYVKTIILILLSLLSIYITFSIDYTDSDNFSKLIKLLSISIFPYIWIFAIGIIFRIFWSNIKKYLINYGIYYFTLYIIYSIFITYFEGTIGKYRSELYISTIIGTILLSFAMFSMAFSYTQIKFNRKMDLSYSTYLYHMLIIQTLIGFGITGSAYLYLVVLGTTFAIAYLSWTYVEKPMLRLKPKI